MIPQILRFTKGFRFLLLVSTLLIFTLYCDAQTLCPNCPQVIALFDTSNCQNGVILESTTGYTNVTQGNIHLFKVCKNTKMKYVLNDFSGCGYNLQATNIVVTGGTLITSSLNTFTIQWGNGNNGNVQFTVHNGNAAFLCDTLAKVFFDLINSPIAAFTVSPQPACFNNPTTLYFNSNATQNTTNYFWDFGDGYTGIGPNPLHNYTAAGSYQVCLYASNTYMDPAAGSISPSCPTCVDSECHSIVIDALPAPPIKCIATVCAGKNSIYTTTASGCSSYVWSVVGGSITSGQGTNTIQCHKEPFH
jgi:PKD domain/PKD-like domain